VATPERIAAGGRTVEVVRMKNTEAGRRVLRWCCWLASSAISNQWRYFSELWATKLANPSPGKQPLTHNTA
jgi:hypothetical protein